MAEPLKQIHKRFGPRLATSTSHRIQRTLEPRRRRTGHTNRKRPSPNRLLDIQRPSGRERPRSSSPQTSASRLRPLQQIGGLLPGLQHHSGSHTRDRREEGRGRAKVHDLSSRSRASRRILY